MFYRELMVNDMARKKSLKEEQGKRGKKEKTNGYDRFDDEDFSELEEDSARRKKKSKMRSQRRKTHKDNFLED